MQFSLGNYLINHVDKALKSHTILHHVLTNYASYL